MAEQIASITSIIVDMWIPFRTSAIRTGVLRSRTKGHNTAKFDSGTIFKLGLPNLKIVPESNFAVLCPFVRERKTPVRIADVRKGIHMSTIIEVMLAIFAATAGSAPHDPVIIILD